MLSRRQIIRTALSSGIFLSLPISSLRSEEKTNVIWHGFSIMEACDDDCANLARIYPNIYSIYSNTDDKKRVFDALTQQIQSKKPGGDVFDLIIPSAETSLQIEKLAEKGGPDVGWLVGVTSEADIASNYYEAEGKSLLIYEIQCYSIIFNIKNFQVLNSFPMRLLNLDGVDGRKNKKTLRKLFLNALVGGSDGGDALPAVFGSKLKNIDFRTADNLSVRVTKVTPTKSMKKWLKVQNKTEKELKSILGNSLTTSVSEAMNIPVQPFSVNKFE